MRNPQFQSIVSKTFDEYYCGSFGHLPQLLALEWHFFFVSCVDTNKYYHYSSPNRIRVQNGM